MTTPQPFVVFGSPRSRTAWLSKFMTYGEWKCGHDETRHLRALDDIEAWFSQRCIGTVETAAAPFWRTVMRYAPSARVVVVRRRPEEVVDSLVRLRVPIPHEDMLAGQTRLAKKLEQIAARWPGAISVDFESLKDEATCARIFEHCLPYPHDPAWWRMMDATNVQVDLQAVWRYMAAYQHKIGKLAHIAKHQTQTEMLAKLPVAPEGMMFQVESLEDWHRDVPPLAREHCYEAGEAPEDAAWKNYPLGEQLYKNGALQITTARSNGRMFGYLFMIIAPTPEHDRFLSAHTSMFYASKEFPGLGMKLQRAALGFLKARGDVGEVVMRAGVRGAGPRLGTMFRRLGATDHGQLYRLNIQ